MPAIDAHERRGTGSEQAAGDHRFVTRRRQARRSCWRRCPSTATSQPRRARGRSSSARRWSTRRRCPQRRDDELDRRSRSSRRARTSSSLVCPEGRRRQRQDDLDPRAGGQRAARPQARRRSSPGPARWRADQGHGQGSDLPARARRLPTTARRVGGRSPARSRSAPPFADDGARDRRSARTTGRRDALARGDRDIHRTPAGAASSTQPGAALLAAREIRGVGRADRAVARQARAAGALLLADAAGQPRRACLVQSRAVHGFIPLRRRAVKAPAPALRPSRPTRASAPNPGGTPMADQWLTTLVTNTPGEGLRAGITLSRRGVKYTQPGSGRAAQTATRNTPTTRIRWRPPG